MGGIISYVEPDSIAEELGWEAGDEVVSINGNPLADIIDYRFYSADEFLTVVIRRGHETAEFEIEKDYEDQLGLTFTDNLFDGVRTCGSHCIFCFVEQLPKGLRKSLYLKDDDYRLSFLDGNFVTLANVSPVELERIKKQRLSPLYLSVHTTNQDLRQKIIGRQAPDILEQIDELTKAKITLHTQIVLCRGINDGRYLTQSIKDLTSRHPAVESIAVVPVGVTAHRTNKVHIEPIDKDYSLSVIKEIRKVQKEMLREHGTRMIWAADEFYLSAGLPLPSASSYEGFPQYENGIGIVRKFIDSIRAAKKILDKGLSRKLKVSLVTGQSAAPVLKNFADSVKSDYLDIAVYPIENRLFGKSVTVTGLMSGQDIIDQLKGKELGDVLFIPDVSLRDNMFLDDITLKNLQDDLGVKVISVEPSAKALAVMLRNVAGELD